MGIVIPFYLYFEQMIRHGISNRPDLVPFFLPIKPEKLARIPASLLDASLTGELVAIKGANQYIELHTREGQQHLIRMTLKDAEKRLSDKAGLRIHRSWWISKPELANATLSSDQQKIISADGVEYPIGSTRLKDIETFLKPAHNG